MAKFIQLTALEKNIPLWINVDLLEAFHADEKIKNTFPTPCTHIYVTGDNPNTYYLVAETPDQILEKISQ